MSGVRAVIAAALAVSHSHIQHLRLLLYHICLHLMFSLHRAAQICQAAMLLGGADAQNSIRKVWPPSFQFLWQQDWVAGYYSDCPVSLG